MGRRKPEDYDTNLEHFEDESEWESYDNDLEEDEDEDEF